MSKSRPLAYDRVNLFGPTAINLNQSGNAQVFVLNDEDTKFMPTSIILENALTSGTTTTQPVIVVDNGITGQNISAGITYTNALAAQDKSNFAALVANPVPVITGQELKISTVARATNVATITTASAHGFTAGDIISIEGAGEFNAERVTLLSASGSTLTYSNVGVDVSSTSATSAKVVYGNIIRIRKTTVGVGGERYINAYVVGVYW